MYQIIMCGIFVTMFILLYMYIYNIIYNTYTYTIKERATPLAYIP